MENNRLKTITDYNNILVDIYLFEDLKCLRDNEYLHFDKKINRIDEEFNHSIQFLIKEYEIVESKYYTMDYSNYFFFDSKAELITMSSEIKYRVGTVLIYYPYLTPVNNYLDHDLLAKRFHFELPIAYESLYKFWQRLSDYLLAFFPDAQINDKNKRIKNSYFHTSLDYINSNYSNLLCSSNYQWIKNFRENDYKQLNKFRKEFVHKSGYVVTFYQRFRKAKTEQEKYNLNKERQEHVEFLINQTSKVIEGFVRFMSFISELEISRNENGKFDYYFK